VGVSASQGVHRRTWREISDEAEDERLGGGGARVDRQLGEDVLDVARDGVRADGECLGSLAVGAAVDEELKDRARAVRPSWPAPLVWLPLPRQE
jgi:hypothetical protein